MKKCMYICLDNNIFGSVFTVGNKVYSAYRTGESCINTDNGEYSNCSIKQFIDANIKLHMIYDEEGNYVGGDLSPSEPIIRRVRWTF